MSTWHAPAPAVTTLAPAVLPFEAPLDEGAYLRAGKRILDVISSAVALVVLAPVIAVLAAIVRLTSRGPVFYRSTRIGRGGRPFTFYKLRSMVKDAELKRQHLSHLNEADGPVFKIALDPRITPIGRFMRSSSLDELPQFWNVLRGDMSLVGPRPPIPEEVAQYEPWQLRRLDVRPGLTCLWQISGRSRIGFQEWMRLDLEYIRHRSFKLDLKILLRTLPAVLSREGAY
jgi:exopolysaccharide biosynthesis polyprenyl glycosylphosphotransferase